MRKVIVLAAVMTLAAVTVGSGYTEQAATEAKVLAKVNGVPIFDTDVPMFAFSRQAAPGPNDEMTRRLLDRAIEMELIVQEARKMGLDKDPQYLTEIGRMKQQEEVQRKQALAAMVQNAKIEELSKGKNISDEEVDSFIQQQGEMFLKMNAQQENDEQKREHVRTMLRHRNAYVDFEAWLKEKLASAEVTLNGKKIPQDVLVSSAASVPVPPVMQAQGPPAPPEANRATLTSAIVEMLGIKEGADAGKTLSEAVLKVNGKELSLAGDPGLDMVLQRTNTPAFAYDPFFWAVRTEILVQQAAGMSIDGKGTPAAFWPVESEQLREKQVLVSLFERQRGAGKPAEVTEEEVQEYYNKNKARWEKRGGLEKARLSIKSILSRQKASGEREKFIENLKANAKIEIVQ